MNTNTGMMLVFDVIISIMGIYIIVSACKMRKQQTVPSLFVAVEEMAHCKDVPGFITFLFPRAVAFGGVALFFGVEEMCNDLIMNLGQIVNIVMIVLFIAAWIWFSMQLRKGKQQYF